MILHYNSNAQSYYYQYTTGPNSGYDYSNQLSLSHSVLSSAQGNKNDVLSPIQTLPFSWTFYGDTVTQYKVSDNGYITFDTSSTVSYGNNTTLPSIGGPHNAIYAFWDDLELQTGSNGTIDNIVNWTFGTAPNRVHVIQWSDVTKKGASPLSSRMYFCLFINESGGFQIVYNWGVNGLNGTSGVENKNDSLGTIVNGSPNLLLPLVNSVIVANMPVYSFIYGTQPQTDICGLSSSVIELAAAGTSVNISGKLINYGAQTINNFTLNYTIDNGTPARQTKSGLTITNNNSYTFTHNIPWTAAGVGVFHTIKIWADSVNGFIDNNTINDTIETRIFVNNGTAANKKVLIEEFSTAPCGFCPDGHFVLDTILSRHHNILGVGHHAGYQTDAMTISASSNIASEFTNGAPFAAINRTKWPNEALTATSNRAVWSSRAVSLLNKPSPVSINVSTNWTAGTRNLDIDVNLNFVDYAFPGDMRISVFVIEDSVIGSGNGYDQTNYYNNSTNSPFFGKGDPMPNYPHRHVLRAAPSTTWGTSAIIPNGPAPGQNYSQHYSYTVPASYNEDKMSVIAFVNYYDVSGRREILNVEEHQNITVGIKDNPISKENNLRIYPNPASELTFISFDLVNEEKVSLEIYSMLGEKVFSTTGSTHTSGSHTFAIDAANLANGVYNVVLNTTSGTVSKKLLVKK